MKKRLLGFVLCGLIAVSSMSATACLKHKIDDDAGDKSVLYVTNYNGGFGEDWIAEVEKRFETKYEKESFETGKTGVDIRVLNEHDGGSAYLDKVDAAKGEVFFIEDVDYYEWMSNNKLLEITDVVNATLSDGKSVYSKMTPEQQSFYNYNGQGKYYALPHHDHQTGLIYDMDLFETEEFYFAKNGAPSEAGYAGTNKFTGDKDNASAGPDGKYGTSDDGLPATYTEFYALCDYMVSKNTDTDIVPIIWSGSNRRDYLNWFLSELMADYEGKEQLELNYTYNGTAKNLIEINNGQVEKLPETQITPETGYKIYKTAGRYYALEFLDNIADHAKWNAENNYGTLDQHQAQYQFLAGKTGQVKTKEGKAVRYAFLMDGNWWENEAKDDFARLVDNFGDSYSNTRRNFAFMPLPKATVDKIGEDFTIATTDLTNAFIKASIAESKVKLAKEFLKFCYEDAQLQSFNKITGLPASVNYELDKADYKALSKYGQSCYDVRKGVVAPYSQNKIYINNYSSLRLCKTFSVGGVAVVDELQTTTAKAYFSSLCKNKANEAAWKQSYSKWFN